MKFVFMGTPEFAIPSLQALMNKHTVLAVVTAADKPAGRGHLMHSSALKQFSTDHHIPVLQPKNLKSEKFIAKLKKLEADLFVVVAFRMLPEIIWAMPKHGTINLHASLLPKYRGAAPIQRAIMNGEKVTGLTVFKLQSQIDTGDIICQSSIQIGDNETGGELHDRMMNLGAELLLNGLDKLENGNVEFLKQEDTDSSDAPKLFRNDCEIHWNQNVDKVYNHIRALSPYPCAWFKHINHTYKIYKCHKIHEIPLETQGQIVIRNNSLLISCLDGYIEVFEIQPEGKRKMNAMEFMNGFKSKHL